VICWPSIMVAWCSIHRCCAARFCSAWRANFWSSTGSSSEPSDPAPSSSTGDSAWSRSKQRSQQHLHSQPWPSSSLDPVLLQLPPWGLPPLPLQLSGAPSLSLVPWLCQPSISIQGVSFSCRVHAIRQTPVDPASTGPRVAWVGPPLHRCMQQQTHNSRHSPLLLLFQGILPALPVLRETNGIRHDHRLRLGIPTLGWLCQYDMLCVHNINKTGHSSPSTTWDSSSIDTGKWDTLTTGG